MMNTLKRSTDKMSNKKEREMSIEARLTTVGILIIKINEAIHVKEGQHNLYCQFTCGTQRIFSRIGGRKISNIDYEGGEVELVWDELLYLLVEQRAREIHVTVWLQSSHSLDNDKIVGQDVVRLTDCREYQTNDFCIKLPPPLNSQVFFQLKFFSLFTQVEAKEYEEFLTKISEMAFLELFKKDRFGFNLSEADLVEYKAFCRSKAKDHVLLRSFSKKKWHHIKTVKEFKTIARKKGLPLGHRAEMWMLASKAKQRKSENKGMYWTLLHVHKDEFSTHTALIQKDLARTFPGHKVFLSKRGREPLRRVLTAYAWKNSSIGYCQSMNFVAAFLLLLMDEESAFWLLSIIVEEILPDYYAPVMIGAKADQIVFRQLVSKKLPTIFAHFESLKVPFHQISLQWFLSIFIDLLPTETTLRVFDSFFVEGAVILQRVGLAILKMKERAILATKEFEECWVLLKSLPRMIYDSDALMKIAFGELGSFKDLKVSQLREDAYREIAEQESLSNFQSLRQLFRFLNGKTLRIVQESLLAHCSSSQQAGTVTVMTPSDPSTSSLRIDYNELHETLSSLNDTFVNEYHVKTLFKAVDHDMKGTVDYFELVCGLSVIFNGVPLEKLLVCFNMYDQDKDGKLNTKELQAFVGTHYKWLLRVMNKSEWRVQGVVQHDVDALMKKVKPYLEEKGGMVSFVEFRFKIATELEHLDVWLRTDPTMPIPRHQSRVAAEAMRDQMSASRSDELTLGEDADEISYEEDENSVWGSRPINLGGSSSHFVSPPASPRRDMSVSTSATSNPVRKGKGKQVERTTSCGELNGSELSSNKSGTRRRKDSANSNEEKIQPSATWLNDSLVMLGLDELGDELNGVQLPGGTARGTSPVLSPGRKTGRKRTGTQGAD